MEDLDRLKKVLKKISKLCFDIQKETLEVMKTIKLEGKELAEDIQEDKPHIDEETLIQMLKDTSMALTEDAEKISEELDSFSAAIATGKDLNSCNCPFMREVWYGDAYDGCVEIDGLNALCQDLRSQLENISLENVIDTVVQVDTVG